MLKEVQKKWFGHGVLMIMTALLGGVGYWMYIVGDQHPKGTVSYQASAEQLQRDGIKVSGRKPVKPGQTMNGGHQHG